MNGKRDTEMLSNEILSPQSQQEEELSEAKDSVQEGVLPLPDIKPDEEAFKNADLPPPPREELAASELPQTSQTNMSQVSKDDPKAPSTSAQPSVPPIPPEQYETEESKKFFESEALPPPPFLGDEDKQAKQTEGESFEEAPLAPPPPPSEPLSSTAALPKSLSDEIKKGGNFKRHVDMDKIMEERKKFADPTGIGEKMEQALGGLSEQQKAMLSEKEAQAKENLDQMDSASDEEWENS